MPRIIGGRAGGRRINAPRGGRTRPTSDRVREALFSAVESWAGSLEGLRVLDLYAGSGAVGLEAWSRGAEHVMLVERDRATGSLLRANADLLGCADLDLRVAAVADVLQRRPDAAYDLVFIDPPYAMSDELVTADLGALTTGGWLAPDALVVVERSVRSGEPQLPSGLTGLRAKTYGETVLWFADADVETSRGVDA